MLRRISLHPPNGNLNSAVKCRQHAARYAQEFTDGMHALAAFHTMLFTKLQAACRPFREVSTGASSQELHPLDVSQLCCGMQAACGQV